MNQKAVRITSPLFRAWSTVMTKDARHALTDEDDSDSGSRDSQAGSEDTSREAGLALPGGTRVEVSGVEDLATNDVAGSTVYLVLDVSGSMRKRFAYLAPILQRVYQSMVEAGVARVQYVLFDNTAVPFPEEVGWEPRVIREASPPNESLLVEAGGGNTALVDALLACTDDVKMRGPGKYRVVLLTDGQENRSQAWSLNHTKRPESIARVAAALAAGVFMAIVGFVEEWEKSELEVLAAALGITNVHVHVHQGTDATVRGSMDEAETSVTGFTTGG